MLLSTGLDTAITNIGLLYIDNDKESIIFEVIGQHPNFQRNVVYARPDASRSYVSNVYVATLRDDDIADVKEAAKQVRVDNDTVDWDCQDYVLELLDKLEDEFILEEDDEDYREARKELKKRRGAIL